MSPNPLRDEPQGIVLEDETGPYLRELRLTTLRPLRYEEYFHLLERKPVADWEKMTTFLIDRHMLSLPTLRMITPETPDLRGIKPDTSVIDEKIRQKKEKIAAAQAKREADQKAAKSAKIARRKAAHDLRMQQQQAAKAKRVEARQKAEAARVQAAKARIAQVTSDSDVKSLKTGADVKRWLEARRAVRLQGLTNVESMELAFGGLSPVEFGRVISRPVRPIVPLSECVLYRAAPDEASKSAYIRYQHDIREAERHLHYMFNEADSEGWRKVVYKKIERGGKRKH